MGLATDSLDNFKKAIDEGNTAPLADMLADNVIFENTECEQEDKPSVLAWAMVCSDSTGVDLSSRLISFLCHNLIPELLYHKPIWPMSHNGSV